MTTPNQPNSEIIIYNDQQGPNIKVSLTNDTVWLSQAQMVELFGKDVRTISEHIKNIYKESELSQNQTIRKFRIVQMEGKKEVARDVIFYNLDVIISVGYRVNSKRGTQFRIWATSRLRDYIIKGFALNEQRLKERQETKLKELEGAVKLLQHAVETKRLDGYEKELLNIITDYTKTWVLLNRYDHDKLDTEGVTKKVLYTLDYDHVKDSISRFKSRLMKSKEATDLFGNEVDYKLKSILGNIEQTYDKKPLYPSIEEKAAHLLYFAIKDHPFTDGNKRIGALLFLLYLIENHHLYNRRGERIMTDNTLTALALLIAESNPDHKEVMIKLVVNLIKK